MFSNGGHTQFGTVLPSARARGGGGGGGGSSKRQAMSNRELLALRMEQALDSEFIVRHALADVASTCAVIVGRACGSCYSVPVFAARRYPPKPDTHAATLSLASTALWTVCGR